MHDTCKSNLFYYNNYSYPSVVPMGQFGGSGDEAKAILLIRRVATFFAVSNLVLPSKPHAHDLCMMHVLHI